MVALMIADLRPEVESSIKYITDKLTPKAKDRIAETAEAVANDPKRTRRLVKKFLKRYIDTNSAIFDKMFREVVSSLEITWRSYQGFTDPIEQKLEFQQYCSRILAGCWLAIKDMGKA